MHALSGHIAGVCRQCNALVLRVFVTEVLRKVQCSGGEVLVFRVLSGERWRRYLLVGPIDLGPMATVRAPCPAAWYFPWSYVS